MQLNTLANVSAIILTFEVTMQVTFRGSGTYLVPTDLPVNPQARVGEILVQKQFATANPEFHDIDALKQWVLA